MRMFDINMSCYGCLMRCGGPTLDFNYAGSRIYNNGCKKGYRVTSHTERPTRPSACIRDKAKVTKYTKDSTEGLQ